MRKLIIERQKSYINMFKEVIVVYIQLYVHFNIFSLHLRGVWVPPQILKFYSGKLFYLGRTLLITIRLLLTIGAV